MTITNQITLDMCRLGVAPSINAVQGDGNTRAVQITLMANSVPWSVPSGSTAAAAYVRLSCNTGSDANKSVEFFPVD